MICKALAAKVWKHPVPGQIEALEAKVGARAVYVVGRGDESFDACLASYRGQPGTLYIAADMRVFGSNRKAITEAVDKLERAGIRVVDLAHPDLKSHAAQLEYALAKLGDWARWQGRKGKARSIGRAGGLAKRAAEEARRESKMPARKVRKFVAFVEAGKITWDELSDALGEGFSVATLQRKYRNK